ncbi:hypothetical protein BDN72DRAFT_884108 [Pluteus cervinus]|uniref:Uncharacterized protein n=1 Tax=Pluteus cervinus TaxID=181527 RepID=A0ACD2ZZP8_9AGAR|nr:hypothetical protein BDN72DRAFT_884108 [Pluteus cervinus]
MRFASYATVVLSFFGAAVALPPGRRASVSDLVTDVKNVVNQIQSTFYAIDSELGPDGHQMTPTELTDLLNKGGRIFSIAAADAETITTLSEADAQTIFSNLQNASGNLALSIYVFNHQKDFLLGGGGGSAADRPIVFQSLQSFVNGFTAFGNSFVAIAPADLQGSVGTFFQQFAPGLAQMLVYWSQ